MATGSKNCPYWSKDKSNQCKMTKGGLYIPMPEHVEMFCSTARFSQCHQYIRGYNLLRESADSAGFVVNGGRRRFRRVKDHLRLVVSMCDEGLRPVHVLDEQAETIDLSLGGLRIKSRHQIPENSVIALDFGSDFSTPNLRGVGKVKWSEAKNGSDTFEAGVSFSDFNLTHAIGAHLGLPLM